MTRQLFDVLYDLDHEAALIERAQRIPTATMHPEYNGRNATVTYAGYRKCPSSFAHGAHYHERMWGDGKIGLWWCVGREHDAPRRRRYDSKGAR